MGPLKGGGPTFSGFGPTLWDPTMTPKILAKNGFGQNWLWPNQDGQNGIGQSRSLPLGVRVSGVRCLSVRVFRCSGFPVWTKHYTISSSDIFTQ